MKRPIYILFLTLGFFASSLHAQQAVHPGITLYKEGKNAESIRLLEAAVKTKDFQKNAEVWNYLGLSHIKANNFKQARKALEKAAKLEPTNVVFHTNLAYAYIMSRQIAKSRSSASRAIALDPRYVTAYYLRSSANFLDSKFGDAETDSDQMMSIDPTFAFGYVLKSRVLVAQLGKKVLAGSTPKAEIKYLEAATEVLKKGFESSKSDPNHKILIDELDSVEAFYKHFSKEKLDSDIRSEPDPTVTPLKILYKPKPAYTDSARQGNVQGTIQLAVLFGSDGKIQKVLVLKRLGSGLDENVMSAAYKIRFEPLMKDGKPVSTVRTVEYSFSIY